jgi:hypothetical protein
MGHRNTLSGHIQEPWYVPGSDRAIARLWHYNRRVIRSLPLNDEWPFLSRRMMATSPMWNIYPPGTINTTYRGLVIYFGGSFSSLFEYWPEWLDKFESLLRRLYWEHALVALETEWMGGHVCRWQADLNGFSAEKPTPITRWTFEGLRDFR